MTFWKPITAASDLPHLGTKESEILDFKAQGYGKGDHERAEAARDVAQFANQLGGTLILGAQEKDRALTDYVDLPDITDQANRIRDICGSRLEPSISLDFVELNNSGIRILAVNVPASIAAVAVRSTDHGKHQYEFPVRRNDQRQYLTIPEVMKMETSERRGLLLIESIPQRSRHNIRIDAEFINEVPPRGWAIKEIGREHMTIKSISGITTGIFVYIPLAFIEAVWPSDSYGEYTITVRACLRSFDNGNKIEVTRAWAR